jgi:F-type H+-transporting ATPase subunit delta
MKGTLIASRYAKSLIDLAREKNMLDKTFADMRLVNVTCKSSHELMVFLRSPIIRNDKKEAVLKAVFEGQLSEITSRFLDIITIKRREMYIPDIAESFISQYKKMKDIHTAEIITAAPIDEKLRKEVLDIVKGFTRSEVELTEKVNPGIIGGYILTVEDKQDDTSIRTKINKLRRVFKENFIIREN